MDQFEILVIIFEFADNLLVLRNICRQWFDVCEFLLKKDKIASPETKWYQVHLNFKKMITKRCSLPKPNGMLIKKYWSPNNGILFQIFTFYDSKAKKSTLTLYCTDYVGLRLQYYFFDENQLLRPSITEKCSFKTDQGEKTISIVFRKSNGHKLKYYFNVNRLEFIEDASNLDTFRNQERIDYVKIYTNRYQPEYSIIIDSKSTLLLSQTSVKNLYLPHLETKLLESSLISTQYSKTFRIIDENHFLITFQNLMILLGCLSNQIKMAIITNNLLTNQPKSVIKCSKIKNADNFVVVSLHTPTKEKSVYKMKFIRILREDDFIVTNI